MGLEPFLSILHCLHIKPVLVYAVINVFGLKNTSPAWLRSQLMSLLSPLKLVHWKEDFRSCFWGIEDKAGTEAACAEEQRLNYRELQDEPGDGICILQTSQPRDLQAAPRIHHQDSADIEN